MAKDSLKKVLLSLLVLVGCSTIRVYDTDPSYQQASNDSFDLLIEPQPAAGRNFFNAFRFVITNKTDQPMTIDWLNTHYIHNGRRNGQFAFGPLSLKT